MAELTDKIALVTGAGRGIGRATAELLASEGASIVLTARTKAQIREVAEEIAATGATTLCVAGDITDEAFAAPHGVNVFDTTLFSTAQKPW